jgi:hypothetical protein
MIEKDIKINFNTTNIGLFKVFKKKSDGICQLFYLRMIS